MKPKLFALFLPFALILPAAAPKLTAELIVVGANARTMDKADPKAEAISVLGGRIVYQAK